MRFTLLPITRAKSVDRKKLTEDEMVGRWYLSILISLASLCGMTEFLPFCCSRFPARLKGTRGPHRSKKTFFPMRHILRRWEI